MFHGGVIFGIFSVFVSVRYFTDFTLSAPSCGIILFNNFKLIVEVCLPWILVTAQSFPSCGAWASHWVASLAAEHRVPAPLAGRGITTARGILRLCPASACQTGLPWMRPAVRRPPRLGGELNISRSGVPFSNEKTSNSPQIPPPVVINKSKL